MRVPIFFALAAVSCSLTTSPAPSVTSTATARAATSAPTFRLSATQARMITTLQRFLDSYNAGVIDAAASLVTDDIVGSDCNYRGVRVVTSEGREAFLTWLRTEIADQDRLELQTVFNENPDGGAVVGAGFSRTSNTLRALGFADGIHPELVAKVVFTADGSRIRVFANGPVGGDSEYCRAK